MWRFLAIGALTILGGLLLTEPCRAHEQPPTLAPANPVAAQGEGSGDDRSDRRSDNGAEPHEPETEPVEGPAEQDAPAARTPLVWRVWPLLDPFHSRREVTFAFGLDELREQDSARLRSGWTLAFGETMTTFRPGFWVTLDQSMQFRSARGSTYMLELLSYEYLAGVRLFGVEVGGGVGLVPIGVDVSGGDWSLSLLSPRSVARAGINVGSLRISLDAFHQYTWRCWGEPSAWVRGFAIQVAAKQPRITHRGKHPLILAY